MERYKRNRWHRSKGEEIATTLLGFVGLVAVFFVLFWLAR